MKRIYLLLFCAFFGFHSVISAQNVTLPKEDSVLVYCRSTSSSPTINIKDEQGSHQAYLSKEYVLISTKEVKNLKRKGCFTYEYLVEKDSLPNHFTIQLKKKKFAIGVSAGYLTTINTGDWILENHQSHFFTPSFWAKKYSLGFNIYRQLYAYNRHRIGLDFDIGYNKTDMTLTTDSYFDSFSAVDPYNIEYTREVFVSDCQESHKVQSMYLPISLRYDWFFLKWMSFFVSTGIQNELVLTNDSEARFNAQYSGRYGDEYFNSYLDQNGYYDFGYYEGNKFVTQEGFPGAIDYILHATASSGFQIFLGRTVSIEIACTYSKLIFDALYQKNDNYFMSIATHDYQSMLTCRSPKFGSYLGGKFKLKINF